MNLLNKYPRTKHLEGSKLQDGDEGMGDIGIDTIPDDLTWVIEEKIDGANAGFKFNENYQLLLNSRGRFLSNDRNALREDDWKLFKDYTRFYEDQFLDRFEDKYHVYGEWMAIVHSVFYDRLPHYFMEFDILDLENNSFLSTERRLELCEGLPLLSVPVLYSGPKPDLKTIRSLASQESAFQTLNNKKPAWYEELKRACGLVGDNYDERVKKLMPSSTMEGVYIKLEKDGQVVDRLKFVNHDFTQTIQNSEEHWQSRFPVPNILSKTSNEFPLVLSNKKDENKIYSPMRPYDWKKNILKPSFEL